MAIHRHLNFLIIAVVNSQNAMLIQCYLYIGIDKNKGVFYLNVK